MYQLQKLSTPASLSVSLSLHVALLFLIGGTVLVIKPAAPTPPLRFIGDVPPDVNTSPPVTDPPPDDLFGSKILGEPVDLPLEPDSPPLISGIPEPFISTNIGLPLSGVGPARGPAFHPPGRGLPDKDIPHGEGQKIKIFTGEISNVSKLGVILDVSGSAHTFLPAVIRELQKNFDHNPTLLVMGCGMGSEVKDSDVEVKLLGDSKPDKSKDKPGSRTSLGQLAMAEERVKGLDGFIDRLRKRDDVWQVSGGDVNATQYAFRKLIGEGVDTIYWFADFQDRVDPALMQELTRSLKKQGIRVIAHNFSGHEVPPEQAKMAQESGGQLIALVPQ